MEKISNYILQSYDNTLEYILNNGNQTNTRAGKCLTVFGYQYKINISNQFPLLTKRKIWPRSIFAELLWILSGSTNVKDLELLGSKIWSPWRDEEFEKRNNFSEGELGNIYGAQLRKFNGQFDQLAYIIKELKENPTSRRILFNLWNPIDMTSDIVRLPCCHVMFQLFVCNNKLSGMLTQRSGDFAIGIPANIQFYSALIYMLAQQCGYEPNEFIHSIGNAHIYENQIPGVEEYLSRSNPPISPTLTINKAKDIYSYKVDDFKIQNYNPLEPIKIPVAV